MAECGHGHPWSAAAVGQAVARALCKSWLLVMTDGHGRWSGPREKERYRSVID